MIPGMLSICYTSPQIQRNTVFYRLQFDGDGTLTEPLNISVAATDETKG